MRIEVNGRLFSLLLAPTKAARELARRLPLELRLRSYGGFEKVGPIGIKLPTNDRHISARPGDVLLYSGSQIVLMTGSNAWSYPPLARLAGDTDAWIQALGSGDVTVKLFAEADSK